MANQENIKEVSNIIVDIVKQQNVDERLVNYIQSRAQQIMSDIRDKKHQISQETKNNSK